MIIRVRIELTSRVRIWSGTTMISVPSKKARALLAMIALSESGSVLRQVVSATLWSDTERTAGLARLREVIYALRQSFDAVSVVVLELEGRSIRFQQDAVQIEINSVALDVGSGVDIWSNFLADLDHVDPTLDRWLFHIRAKQRQRESRDGPNQRLDSDRSLENVRPSLVLTTFEGTNPDDTQARRLTAEIGAGLVRFRWFTTITRDAHGRRFESGNRDLATIANYALIGSLENDDARHRLLLELVDFRTSGATCWMSTFEQGFKTDLLSHHSLADMVAARLDAELLSVEVDRHKRQGLLHSSSAYSLVMQAISDIYKLERAPFLRAGHILGQAAVIDPESAFVHSWLAYWNVFLVGQDWADSPFQSMSEAGRASERAMLLDPKDARAVTIAGHVQAFLHRRLTEASALHELALQLNPALALAWHFAGMTHAYAGRLDRAHHCITHSLKLTPLSPLSFFAEGALMIVYLLQHDHDRAIDLGRRVIERSPNFTSALKSHLAVLGHLGQRGEGDRVLQRLLKLEPRFSLRRFRKNAPYQRLEDLDHFTEGLRRAGVT